MKFEYQRPAILIERWFVTLANLRELLQFFKTRFGTSEINIKLETARGNNREYESFGELAEDVAVLTAEKETVTKISISHRDEDLKNWKKFRQVWITADFKNDVEARFNIVAGDTDGSHKDWVAGTYEEMQRVAARLSVTDWRLVKKMDSRGLNQVVFDPDRKILGALEAEITEDEKNGHLPQKPVASEDRAWWKKPEFWIPLLIGLISIPWWPNLWGLVWRLV